MSQRKPKLKHNYLISEWDKLPQMRSDPIPSEKKKEETYARVPPAGYKRLLIRAGVHFPSIQPANNTSGQDKKEKKQPNKKAFKPNKNLEEPSAE